MKFSFPNISIRLRLLSLACSALLSVWLGFLAFTPFTASKLVTQFGYFAMLSTAMVFVIFILKVWRLREPGEIEPIGLKSALVIAASWVFSLISEPFNYKILYDEFVLQATAMNMHFNREVSAVVRGYDLNGVFYSLTTYLDKRPYFFPFLLSFTHDLTGYRPSNVFFLNAALSLILICLLYLFARRLAGARAGILAVLLFATLPLFVQNETGAGMELLNLAMILLAMLLGTLWLERRSSERLSSFCVAIILLPETRYESVLYVLPAALVILEGWRREKQLLVNWTLIATPLLLVPYALQNLVLANTKVLWELPENLDSRFGIGHVVENLRRAIRYLFNFDRTLTNSWWLSALGSIALIAWVIRFIRLRQRIGWSAPAVVIVFFSIAIVGNLGLLMFYFWGGLDDWLVARLSLPFLLLLILATVGWIRSIRDLNFPVEKIAIGLTVVHALAFTFPAFAGYLYTSQNVLMREIDWERRFLSSREKGTRLIITNKSSVPWIIDKTASLLIQSARIRQDGLRYHLEQKTFNEIIVSQRLRATTADGDFTVDIHDRLPPNFVLKTLAIKRFGATLDCVSQLVAIEPIIESRKSDSSANPKFTLE